MSLRGFEKKKSEKTSEKTGEKPGEKSGEKPVKNQWFFPSSTKKQKKIEKWKNTEN